MKRRTLLPALLSVSWLIPLPATAQDRGARAAVVDEEVQQLPPPSQPVRPVETGRVSVSAIGRAGERQTRDQVVGLSQPLGRINNRINTRLSLRLRSRIDRNYDPSVSATSSFEAAEDQLRATNHGLTR